MKSSPVLLLVILLFGLVSCSSPRSTPVPDAPPPTPTAAAGMTPAVDADAMLEAGRKRVSAGDLNAAEALCQSALALDPRSGKAHAALSRLHLDLGGHDEEALSDAREAVRLAPKDAAGWVALAYALGRNLRGPEALEAARKAVSLNDQDPAALAALSYAQLRQRLSSDALNAARRAVKADASFPEAYIALADAYAEGGDFARARAAAEKAVALEPGNLVYETRLGDLLAGMGLYDDASAAFRSVVERGRSAGLDYRPAMEDQIYVALARGDDARAEEQIAAVLKLSPTATGARLARARLYWRRGEYGAAEAAYGDVIKSAPRDFGARLGLARLLLEEEQCTTAADIFRDLAAEQPRLASPLIGQAWAAHCTKDAQRAIELFRQAIELEPCNAEALAGLGTLYAQQGRHDDAQAIYSRSWRCSASGANVQIEIGGAALNSGDPTTALDAFTLAQRLDPAQPDAKLGLCMAYLATGNEERGLSACERAGEDPLTEEPGTIARAAALIAAGRYAEAAASLQPLEARLAGDARLHHLLGVAHLGLKDYQAALDEYEILGKSAGPADPRLGALLKALESGWELTGEAAQTQLREELPGVVGQRPGSVTIESGTGGRKLALEMTSLPGDSPQQILKDATALMVLAGRYTPRIEPPVVDGVEVRIADAGGERLYALQVGLEQARRLATLQSTDDQFVRSLRLANEGPGGALTADEVEAIAAKVAELRGLPAPTEVPVVRMTRQAYAGQLGAANTLSSWQLSDAAALEVLLGLLQPGADLAQLQIDLNSSIVTGFYDKDAGALALIDQTAGSWQDRLTIAHEYEHALQDQEFASTYLSDNAASEDMRLALRALVEGDAELSEAAYLQERIPVDGATFYAWTASDAAGPEPGAVPPFMKAMSAFPYDAGLRFVRSAYETGGWADVNRLFSSPPVSTEQILHPERYRSGHQPVAVALPALATALGGDWGLVETGVMGEARWRASLAPFIGMVPAAAAAEGWGGDRYALLRRGTGGEYAAAFETTWDDWGEAGEFAELVGTWLDRRTGYGQEVSDLLAPEPDRHWVQGQLHWLVRRQGERVTIVVASGADLASELLEAGYPSAYECRADTWAASGSAGEQLAKLDKAIEAHPGADALLRRAGIHWATGDRERAMADLDRAIELDRDNAGAYVERGRAHYLQGDYAAAVADLARGLDLRPGDYTAYLYLGRAYTAQEDYGRAEQDFTEAMSRYTRDPYLHQYRGDVYWSRGEYDRARADYQAAVELLPDFADPDCHKALLLNVHGHLWEEQGDYEKAVAAFGQGLKLQPEDTQGWYDRGSVYFNKGDYDKALADFGRAIELRPAFATAYQQRGYVYVAKEDYKPALADFVRAIELEPEGARGYYGRGYAYLQRGFGESDAGQSILASGDFGKAIADCNKAIELDPEIGAAYYRRGQAYHARGDRATAITDYTRALELQREWSDPYRNRGYAHAEQGEKSLAIADFEKYLELTDDEESRAKIAKEIEELRGAP